MKSLHIIYVCFLVFFICCQTSEVVTKISTQNIIKEEVKYLQKINNAEEFKSLQGNPLSLKYSGIQSVKVVYDLKSKSIYFLNDKYFTYHVDFCTKELKSIIDVYDFNQFNYHQNSNRKFVLGNINYFSSNRSYVLDFANSEIISQDNIDLFNAIKENVFFKEKFFLYPSTSKQKSDFENLKSNTPFLTTDELYAQLNYQGLVQKEAYGYLRKVSVEDLKNTSLTNLDILFTNGTPLEITAFTGIITNEFQTTLSHLCILSQNRKTPLMAYKNAWEDPYINSLINQPVHLIVKYDTFYLRKTSDAKVLEAQESQNTYVLEPSIDTTFKTLIDCEKLKHKDIKFAGGKGAHMGELLNIRFKGKQLPLPEKPFVIPIYFYKKHLQKCEKASYWIDVLLNEKNLSADSTKNILKIIRKDIKNQKLDSDFLNLIHTKCTENFTSQNVRFRSSSNVEDLDGFNGAGLYNSKSAILNDTSKTIEKAIKNVWASLWNEGAYHERIFFHVNQKSIGMAILVHPSFGEENINAVAITKNIYRPEQNGVLFNLQKGELPVVFNSDGITTEQFLLLNESMMESENYVCEPISFSSLSKNKSLLSFEEQKLAFEYCIAIKKHYFYNVPKITKKDYLNFAMDIEMKWIGNENKLYIKQARVYND